MSFILLKLLSILCVYIVDYAFATVLIKESYYTVFEKKTSTHMIGYKMRNSCLILIIVDIKIPHII